MPDPCTACERRMATVTRQTPYGPLRLCWECEAVWARDFADRLDPRVKLWPAQKQAAHDFVIGCLAKRAEAAAERNRQSRAARRKAALLGWKRRRQRSHQ